MARGHLGASVAAQDLPPGSSQSAAFSSDLLGLRGFQV